MSTVCAGTSMHMWYPTVVMATLPQSIHDSGLFSDLAKTVSTKKL